MANAATSRALIAASHRSGSHFSTKPVERDVGQRSHASPALGLRDSSIQGLFSVDTDVSDFGYDFRKAIFSTEKWRTVARGGFIGFARSFPTPQNCDIEYPTTT